VPAEGLVDDPELDARGSVVHLGGHPRRSEPDQLHRSRPRQLAATDQCRLVGALGLGLDQVRDLPHRYPLLFDHPRGAHEGLVLPDRP